MGELVRYGMRQRAMGQAELARASGLSDATIRQLERGQPGNYRERTLSKLDTAFGWPPGTLAHVRDGEPAREVISRLEQRATAESGEGYVATALRDEIDALTHEQQHIALAVVRALRKAGPIDAPSGRS